MIPPCFASHRTAHMNLAHTYIFFPWDCREMSPAPQEVTHLDHKLEACTACFSGAGVPKGLASGESTRYLVLHTLLPFSFPGTLSTPKTT